MNPSRITLVEYEPYHGFIQAATAQSGLDRDGVRSVVATHARRIEQILRTTAPIRLDGDTLIAEDVAGVVRLTPRLELEIAPKFLGSQWPTWREDFLLVANVARSGQLLVREGVASSAGAREDLVSLVARTFLQLFEQEQRRPLRTYRLQTKADWSLDGDFEAEEILLPDAEGYRLRQTVLTGSNRYNAQISGAAQSLAAQVRDGVLQRQLQRVAFRLGPQTARVSRPATRVPTRHSAWQRCLEMANEINAGLGVRLMPGAYKSPGYVLTTWLAFEHLLEVAFRVALPGSSVTYHPRFKLGYRTGGRAVTAEPDFVIRRPEGTTFVVDSKYKGRADRSSHIAPADLYEALAFAQATGQSVVTLVYPRPTDETTPEPVGTIHEFDAVTVGDTRVVGATVECRGISRRGGFDSFAKGLASLR